MAVHPAESAPQPRLADFLLLSVAMGRGIGLVGHRAGRCEPGVTGPIRERGSGSVGA